MRRSTAAVLAVGSAFALTAAAATAISVTGPFDPAAGSAPATTCDIGDTTIDSLTDGADLLGFTLSTTNDTSSNLGCTNADIWLRVDYTDTTDATQSLYATLPADVDYTGGTDLTLDTDFSTDLDLTTPAAALPLTDETITNTAVLVTTTPPSNFAPAAPVIGTCYGTGIGPDVRALTGPIDSANNFVAYQPVSGTCTGEVIPSVGYAIVEASNATQANDKCVMLSATEAIGASLSSLYSGMPTTWWLCTPMK